MIDLFRPFMSDEARSLVQQVMTPDADGRLYIGEGSYVQEFERRFASEVGQETPPPLAMSSCTFALDLACHLTGIRLGDEVITTPMTCTATNGVLVNRHAKIVWADVDPETGLISPEDVWQKRTTRTKAIVAVDWAGKSCDYKTLRQFGLPVIQDAAHHFYVDPENHGDYVAWSFQAIKHLTTTDGGALLVPEKQYKRAKLLRWYGLDRETGAKDFRCEQDITEAGFKYHMSNVDAAQGLGNLPYVKRNISRHRENARWYDRALKGCPGVQTPVYDPNASYWLYTLLVDDPMALRAHLQTAEIDANPVHKRNDVHTCFDYPNGPLPGVEAFSSREIAIPCGWWVSNKDRERVASQVWLWATSKSNAAKAKELTAA